MDENDRTRAGPDDSDRNSLSILHKTSLLLCIFGSVASSILFLMAARQTPGILIAPFILWLSAPFALLLIAHRYAGGWPSNIRFLFYGLTLLVTLTSVAIYFYQVNWPRQSTPAFYWVAVPPASGLLILITLATSVFALKRKSK